MKRQKTDMGRVWRYFHRVHPWYFLVIAIVFGITSLFALRQNNLTMAKYREAVYAADKTGDSVQIETALHDLRQYVVNHMNTSLTSGNNAVYPPVQLKYTYERAQAAQQAKLGQINANLYHTAQQQCEAENPGETGAETIACIEKYAAAEGIQLGNIPDALYKFDFMSAKWSPDLAGWSIVLTVISLIAFGISAFHHWIKKYL
jgi:hypothetical protein